VYAFFGDPSEEPPRQRRGGSPSLAFLLRKTTAFSRREKLGAEPQSGGAYSRTEHTPFGVCLFCCPVGRTPTPKAWRFAEFGVFAPQNDGVQPSRKTRSGAARRSIFPYGSPIRCMPFLLPCRKTPHAKGVGGRRVLRVCIQTSVIDGKQNFKLSEAKHILVRQIRVFS